MVPRRLLLDKVLPFLLAPILVPSTLYALTPKMARSSLHQDSSVIQSIAHVENPATRDPQLLELQAEMQWAEDIERRIRDDAAIDEGVQPAQLSNKVYLLSFRSGKGELFRKMLLHDKEFEPLRKSLKKAGYPLVLQPSESIVLVRPDQYLQTVNSQVLRSHALKRYNVVIAESEEYLMNEVLLRMASKLRPRENKGERVQVDLYSFAVNFELKRTLLCQAPLLLVGSTVSQSTTEAVRSSSSASSSSSYFAHVRGRNPRRSVLGTWGECE